MRTLTLVASSLAALALCISGCTAETAPPAKVKRGTTSKSPGTENTDGEHGTNVPKGDDKPDDVDSTPITGNETWADGKTIAGNMTINAGTTVDIAPGATINFANDAILTIKGTLKNTSTAAKHAKLTGTTWGGLIVTQGGSLITDGLDFENSKSAIWTQTGNTDATVTNSVIKGETPFKMEAGSKLTLTKTDITATGGSAVAGTFTASHVKYNKSGGGMSIGDPLGIVTISDSVFKGSSAQDSDFVISSSAKSIKIEYSEISQTHCALHFNGVEKFELDHVSLVANSYGAMLYGSGAGPHSIKASNVENNTDKGLDMQNTNGPLTITGSFTTKNALQPNATETAKAAAHIAEAAPRP